MTDFALETIDDMRDIKPDEESLTKREKLQAAWLANELLSRGGWTGAQRDWLDSVVAERIGGPGTIGTLENMLAIRDREDALKP